MNSKQVRSLLKENIAKKKVQPTEITFEGDTKEDLIKFLYEAFRGILSDDEILDKGNEMWKVAEEARVGHSKDETIDVPTSNLEINI